MHLPRPAAAAPILCSGQCQTIASFLDDCRNCGACGINCQRAGKVCHRGACVRPAPQCAKTKHHCGAVVPKPPCRCCDPAATCVPASPLLGAPLVCALPPTPCPKPLAATATPLGITVTLVPPQDNGGSSEWLGGAGLALRTGV